MENPLGLGKSELTCEHMVCRTELFPNQNRLHFEMMLETDQLRILDKASVHMQIFGDVFFSRVDTVKSIEINFGASHTNSGVQELVCFTNPNTENCEIKQKSWGIVISFINKILSWWHDSQFLLARKLQSLCELNLSMMEFQGRISKKDDLDWLKIYGLRGEGDESKWANFYKK